MSSVLLGCFVIVYYQWYKNEGGPHYGEFPKTDEWLHATTSGIYGMGMDGKKSYALIISLGIMVNLGVMKLEAISAYNIAKKISIQVLAAGSSQDPVQGATSYADAGAYNNWYQRTHFWVLEDGYYNAWCMPDVVGCN